MKLIFCLLFLFILFWGIVQKKEGQRLSPQQHGRNELKKNKPGTNA
jgi:hypothetical protein